MNSVGVVERLTGSPKAAFFLAIVLAAAVGVGLAGWGDASVMLAITVFCIVLWVLTPISPAYTGLLGIALIGLAFSTDLALTGFESPATWLIGFGLLMGEATRRSGLASWIGQWLLKRSVPASLTDGLRAYRRALLALSLAAHLLAFFIPSALIRVLVLAPILIEVGENFESRKAKVGLFLGPIFASWYGSSGILTADLPNIIISGMGRSIGDHTITWSEWLFHMYPIMGLTRVFLVVAVVYVLFRPPAGSGVDITTGSLPDPTGTERRMLVFLLLGVGIWVTDFVHGFHPVTGAVVVVALAFLPGIGVADFESAGSDVDFTLLFFYAAVFAIGDGLAHTGFTDDAATSILDVIPSDAHLAVILSIVFLTAIGLSFFMEGLAVASVLTPVVISYAEAAGLPMTPVLMAEAIALSAYFFPYQSAVLIVILAQDVVDTRELIRTTAACSLATIVFLVPLQFLLFSVLY
ncbi:SLC13 family permease [Natrarchaeobaculum aegyptiacum]|uniref:Sodium:sulfate symporter n=1 Tax=Natrarchaeobaculum aegyptiacum TaxID=745377 RepID=A0A2Z2HUY2_9EURY|nr:SLC13 family permease [Natrarchaeobaculum aegyptiacum]ARS91079.1 sodium:sulfate symporter [Natrarchaeobaculum aegyptiacum]